MTDSSLTFEELRSQEAYDRLAGRNANRYPYLESERNEVKLHFKKHLSGGSVIDLGCGSGRDARALLDAGYQYLGVDINEKMLASARARVPGAVFHTASLYALPFKPKSFDGFWAATALTHIPRSRLPRAVEQILKIVKRKGVGFVAVMEGTGERMIPGPLPDIERLFSCYGFDEFWKILEKSGFTVLDAFQDMREVHLRRKFDGCLSRVWLQYFVQCP
jgi:SAM-dependent methyltransferase